MSLLKLHNAVFLVLALRTASVFKDADNALETFGLTDAMFTIPHPHLDETERASTNGLIQALKGVGTFQERRDLLEGRKATSWGAARHAIKKWATKQKIYATIYQRVDDVLAFNDATPKCLIQSGDVGKDEFPDIRDVDEFREDVAVAVFGKDILEDRFRGDLRESIGAIMHHAWERQRKRCGRARKSMVAKYQKASKAVKDLENAETVTAALVRSAGNLIAAYSDAIEWFPKELEKNDGVHELREIMKQVTVTVVGKAKKAHVQRLLAEEEETPARSRGKSRARKIKPVQVSNPGDVDQIWTLYMQLFQLQACDTELPPISDGMDEPTGHAEWAAATENLGIGKYAEMDDATLHKILNFPEGRPALFAKFRSKSGLCAWDNEEVAAKFHEGNADMQPLSLLWHQSAGVAALVSKVYTAQLSDANDDFFPSMQGVLVADEVGLGKTALVMGFQDFLMGDHWVTAENAPSSMDTSNFKRAPILADRPYFAGKRQIPNLPHVIVVPNSLTGQWSSEIVTFHSPQAIEVYHFPTAEKDWLAFWEGDWAKSKVPLINRVVIVPHSVFTTAGRCWDLRKSKKGGNLGKALDEKRHIKSPELEGACIWAHQKFLTCVVDEAHEFRNLNGAFYAVLETARAACFPLLLTATPLYTGPRDLHNLGRLARIAAFCGDQGDEREHACWKQLRTVRRSVTAVDRDASAEYRLKSIAGEEAELPAMPTVKALAKVLHEWIDEIRLGFGDRVIRRTVASKRFDGRRINDSLPESVMIVCPVRFDERTRVIIQDIMDRILSDRSVEGMDDGSKFNKKFYMEGRTKVAFPCFTSPLYAPVKTMEEYREKPSPKLELTIAILYHHLSKDDSVAIHFHAHPDDPAWPLLCTNVPNEKSDTKVSCLTVWDPLCALVPCHVTDKGARKVLIYHEFPMMAPLIESIMKLFHIDILMLNGTQTPEERNAIVHKFNADAQCRVLLFSAVGAVGLNLTVASIVILFDQCWSRMLVNQIIGRAWRLGQTDTVLVYNLVAMGTVDTLMIDHGETKGDMLNTFLAQGGRTITDALRRAADGRMADGDDLDDDDAKLMSDGGPSLSQNKRVKKTGEGGKKATAPVGKVATVIESGGATSRGRSRGSSEQREVAHVSEKASWTEPSKAPDFLQHTNEGEGGVEPVARCGPTPDFVNAHHPLTPEAARPASVPHGEPSSPTSPPTGMQQSSPPLPRVISALHSRPQITKPSVPTTVDVVSTPPLKRTYSSAHSPPVSPPTLHSPPRKKVHVQGSSNPSSGTLVVGGHVLRRSTSTVPVSAPRGRGRQGARGWYGRSN